MTSLFRRPDWPGEPADTHTGATGTVRAAHDDAAAVGMTARERRADARLARPIGLRRALVLIDLTGMALGWLIATVVLMRPGLDTARVAIELGVLGIGTYLLADRLGLYRLRVAKGLSTTAARLAVLTPALAVTLGALAMDATGAAPRRWAITLAAVSFGLLLAARTFFQWWIDAQRAAGERSIPVLLVGSDESRTMLDDLLRFHPENGLRAVGLIGPRPHQRDGTDADTAPWLGSYDQIVPAALASGAQGAIVAASDIGPHELNALVRVLVHTGIHVHLWSGLWGIDSRRLRPSPIAHEPFHYVEPHTLSTSQRCAKRAMDLVVGAVLFVLVAPVLAVAMVAIRVDDGGPVLYRQRRVGRHGEPFTLLKLRTMTTDAPERLDALRDRNERRDGPLFKLTDDPRITRVGAFLRATSIDELPQLLNVLRGDLSLVGPRPALPEEVACFDPEHLVRQTVRPGVTGLWQVEGRDNPAFYVYRHLDLFYVENWSLRTDVRLLLVTVPTVLRRGVAALRHHGEPLPTTQPAAAPAEVPVDAPLHPRAPVMADDLAS